MRLACKNLIAFGIGRAIGRFSDEPYSQKGGGFRGNLVFHRGRNEYISVGAQKSLVIYWRAFSIIPRRLRFA